MTLLRILCLHGYRQNGNIFREKTGSFRKLLKKHVAEFVYIDAPHLIPIQDNTDEQDTNATASNRSNERGIERYWRNYYELVRLEIKKRRNLANYRCLRC
jgi:hypothetical protein